MEQTTITISKRIAKKLRMLKASLGLKKIDDVLDKIFKMITKYKLRNELEMVK